MQETQRTSPAVFFLFGFSTALSLVGIVGMAMLLPAKIDAQKERSAAPATAQIAPTTAQPPRAPAVAKPSTGTERRGSLLVTTEPSGATLWVNGRKLADPAPVVLRDLPIGGDVVVRADRNGRTRIVAVHIADDSDEVAMEEHIDLTAKDAAPGDEALQRREPAGNRPNFSCDNVLPADYTSARTALEHGNRCILLGKFEGSVALGKIALKLDPSMSESHKLLGVSYARQGKYCDAKYHYNKFVELNPTSPMVDRINQILDGSELRACR